MPPFRFTIVTGLVAVLALAGLAEPGYTQALADARPDTLAERGSRTDLEEAARVYLNLLSRVGTALAPEEADVLNRHVAQLALILPSGVQTRLVDGDLREHPAQARFRDGAGETLLAWWGSQDPLPATRNNERLEEHLQRVALAEERYADDGHATGLDARGEVYLRYGAPSRQTVISFNDPKLIDTVYQPGVSISPSDFPANEFWVYRHVDNTGYFLFVQEKDVYRLAETLDLLPRSLQYGFGSTGRGEVKAKMALAVLRSVYRQLALEHPDFGVRFNEVDLFALRQEEDRIGRRLDEAVQQERERNEGLGQRTSGGRRGDGNAAQNQDVSFVAPPDPNALAPGDFVQSMLGQGQSEDAQAFWRRETTMPKQYTEVLRKTPTLPISVRTARFLDDDGTTRTEVYWSPVPGGLHVVKAKKEQNQPDPWSPDQFLIALTVVQQTADYQGRQVSQKPYLVTDLPEAGDALIPAQTMTVRGDTGLYSLALQWDEYRAQIGEAGGVLVGPHIKVGTHRIDSLTALHTSARVLEMSDLKPIYVDDIGALQDAEGFSGTPYPHAQIWPTLPLGLYFEIYHLAVGADDQTHYTIAYEITRSRDEGGLLRFLGRGKGERTVVETPYTGQSLAAREYLLLDLSEWEGAGELEVRVQVTDDVTGRQVSRSLFFDLVGG